MLERLRVRNFALIEEIELEFSPGLNVLTGETGTGKSILLGALSVLLGERITEDLYRGDNTQLQVESAFSAGGPGGLGGFEVPEWLDAADGVILILRKGEKGKRAQNFINQQQTTQTALAELGDHLVDIHGQHQHQLLLKTSTHVDFLDAYGGLTGLRTEFRTKFDAYHNLVNRIAELNRDLKQRREHKDFLAFQRGEIAKLNPQPGEVESLMAERELLASAEKRAELAAKLIELISEQEGAVLETLSQATRMLAELSKLDDTLTDSVKSLNEAELAANDVARALVSYRESIEYSPQRLEEINERLFAFEKLFRKHDTDEQGLIRLFSDIEKNLASIDLDAEEIERLQTQEKTTRSGVIVLACKLSAERLKTKKRFEKAVEAQLAELDMPKARLVVEFSRQEDEKGLYEQDGKRYKLADKGVEDIQFMFSANPGEEPKPLARIASGGELSRIMLALKTVLVDSDQVPVLVFDEIDVGIGGKTAEILGKRLKELSEKKQIILVTHLAQIARHADAHFRVTKKMEKNRTITSIHSLDEEGRVEELARMLGGEKITDTVLAHARELRQGS